MLTVPVLNVTIWAIALAPDPPPPEKVMVGADVYPLPAFVRKTLLTPPVEMTAVAAAPPLEKLTEGTDVYPEPDSTIPIETTAPPLMLATAVALVPPVILGGPMVTSGTAVYPLPPDVTYADLIPPDPVTIVAVATA
jgi:hypothetical protein